MRWRCRIMSQRRTSKVRTSVEGAAASNDTLAPVGAAAQPDGEARNRVARRRVAVIVLAALVGFGAAFAVGAAMKKHTAQQTLPTLQQATSVQGVSTVAITAVDTSGAVPDLKRPPPVKHKPKPSPTATTPSPSAPSPTPTPAPPRSVVPPSGGGGGSTPPHVGGGGSTPPSGGGGGSTPPHVGGGGSGGGGTGGGGGTAGGGGTSSGGGA